MTRRFLVAAAVVLAVGAFGTLPLVAQTPGQRMGGPGRGGRGGLGGPGPGIMPLLQQLGLTDQQREQVRSLMEDTRPPAGSGQQLRDAELQLHEAIFGETPSPQAIDAAKTTLNADHAAELDHQIDLLTKIAQILTPDQRQQLLKLEAQGPPPGRGRF
jgi:Spy/CpxP family protein refolding chaperone